MTEDQLRALIRSAIARHLGSDPAGEPLGQPRRDAAPGRGVDTVVSISFGEYSLERAPDDTSCLIEPAVRCNHCGFCKCHGH